MDLKKKKVLIVEDDSFLLEMYSSKLEMANFEVLREKLAEEDIKNIPVIVLTNLSQKEQIEECYKLGAKDFLIKAYFIPAEVIKKIKNLIG